MLISHDSQLRFEKSRPGRIGHSLPKDRYCSEAATSRIPVNLLRQRVLEFPELTEPEVIRHFIRLSKKNNCQIQLSTGLFPVLHWLCHHVGG